MCCCSFRSSYLLYSTISQPSKNICWIDKFISRWIYLICGLGKNENWIMKNGVNAIKATKKDLRLLECKENSVLVESHTEGVGERASERKRQSDWTRPFRTYFFVLLFVAQLSAVLWHKKSHSHIQTTQPNCHSVVRVVRAQSSHAHCNPFSIEIYRGRRHRSFDFHIQIACMRTISELIHTWLTWDRPQLGIALRWLPAAVPLVTHATETKILAMERCMYFVGWIFDRVVD